MKQLTSIYCEKALLGALLLDCHRISDLPDTLIEDLFYFDTHMQIFEYMQAAYTDYDCFDIPILMSYFEGNKDEIETFHVNLLMLANECPGPNYVGIYATIIEKMYYLRKENGI